MSYSHGQFWYTDPQHFLSKCEWNSKSNSTKFDHDTFLDMVRTTCLQQDETFLHSFFAIYDHEYPPSWMLMELLTFGTISRMFENLKPGDEKNVICSNFGITKLQMVSWLHCFTYLRNKCVHHAKLIHKRIKFAPAMPQKSNRIFFAAHHIIEHDSLYADLCCIQFLLNTCNKKSTLGIHLSALFDESNSIRCELLGFTPDWNKENIWRYNITL